MGDSTKGKQKDSQGGKIVVLSISVHMVLGYSDNAGTRVSLCFRNKPFQIQSGKLPCTPLTKEKGEELCSWRPIAA